VADDPRFVLPGADDRSALDHQVPLRSPSSERATVPLVVFEQVSRGFDRDG
jgi:hypothetical protein